MLKLATLCYLRRNNQTLMQHRVKKKNDMHAGKWNGLGGKFEPGESPEECARREILEETGLAAHNMDLKGILTFPQFANQDDWYAFVYVVTEFSGLLRSSPEGILKWVPDQELLNLNLWEGDRLFIPWLDQENFFSAKFEYTGGKLQSYSVNFYPGQIKSGTSY